MLRRAARLAGFLVLGLPLVACTLPGYDSDWSPGRGTLSCEGGTLTFDAWRLPTDDDVTVWLDPVDQTASWVPWLLFFDNSNSPDRPGEFSSDRASVATEDCTDDDVHTPCLEVPVFATRDNLYAWVGDGRLTDEGVGPICEPGSTIDYLLVVQVEETITNDRQGPRVEGPTSVVMGALQLPAEVLALVAEEDR